MTSKHVAINMNALTEHAQVEESAKIHLVMGQPIAEPIKFVGPTDACHRHAETKSIAQRVERALEAIAGTANEGLTLL